MAAEGSVVIQIDGDDSGFEKSLNGLKSAAGKAAKGVAAGIAGITAALGGAAVAAVHSADSLDQAMNQFASSTGTGKEALSGYENVLKDIYANNYGESFEDIAGAMAAVTQQMGHLDDAELQNVTEAAFVLRDTFGYEVPESVRASKALMDQFGISGEEAMNLIANGAQNGLDFSGELLDSIDEYSVQFAKVGMSADDMFRIFQSGAESGAFNLDKIGDAVKEFAIRAIDGSDTTIDGFQRLGMNADEMAARFAAGGEAARGAFQEVIRGLAEMDDPVSQSIAGVDLFGTMWEDLGPEVVTQLSTINGAAYGAADALDQIHQIRYDDLSSVLEGVRRSVELAAIPIGQALIPKLAEAAQQAGEMVRSLSEAFQTGGFAGLGSELASQLSAIGPQIAAAAPTMLASIGELIQSLAAGIAASAPELWTAGMSIVQTIGDSILAAAPQMLHAALSLMQNLADGISANLPSLIPAALSMLSEISAGLRSGVGQLVDGALAIVQAIGEGIISSLPALIESVPEIVTNIAGIINDNAPKLIETALYLIAQLAKGLVEAIPALIANIPKIIEAIVSVFMAFNWLDLGKTVISMFKNGITAMVGAVRGAAGNVLNAINNTLKNLPQTLLNLGRQGIQGLINGVKSLVGAVGGAIRTVANTILNGIKSLPGKLLDIGKQMIQGLINGIKSGISGVVGAIGDTVSSAVDKAKSLLGIHSPSRVMRDQVGLMIARGMALGISKGEREVLGVADRLNGKLLQKEEQLNEQIAAMEQEARDRQAAAELADYQQKLADKYEQLGKAEISERQKIQAEIAQLEADWNEKQLEAQKEAEQEKLEAQLDTLEKFQEEYEKALDEIEKSQESMANKLAGYGELFSKVEKETGSFLELGDLQADIDAINRYGDALESLKARGVSGSLLDEIADMGVDDATAYTEQLLAMTDDQYNEYMSLWEQKQQAAQQAASQFYRDEMEALGREFVDKIPEELGEVKDEMRDIGVQGIQGMIDGMYSKSGVLYSAAASIVSQAIAAMRAAADIHSPSKKAAKLVGAPLAQGVGAGFAQAYPAVMDKIRTAFDISMAQTSARLQSAASSRGGSVTREVTNNTTTVDRIVRIEVTGSDGEFVRWLRGKLKAEDKRVGGNLVEE